MWRDFLVIFLIIQSSLQQERKPVCQLYILLTICRNIDFNKDADLLKSAPIKMHGLVIKNSFGSDLNETNFKLNETTVDRIDELFLLSNNFKKIDTNNLCTTLKNLQSLVLTRSGVNNRLNGENFKNCAKLKYLTLDNVLLDGGVVPLLPNLQNLSFNNTKFDKGLNLTNLNQLKSLSLHYTNIKDYLNNPELLKQLSKLQILNLDHNQLDSFPANDWKNLQVLDLSSNNFDNTIWQQLNELKSIEILFLENNNIDTIDIKQLLTDHPQLKDIFLSSRNFKADQIEQINEELKNLTSDGRLKLKWKH